ncbi:MAG: DUF4197 domain-containing protein [Tagaea sp.]
MKRRIFLLGAIALPATAQAQSLLDQGRNLLNQGGASVPGGGRGRGLSVAEIAQGLKDALEKGAAAAVARLGRADGFLGDAAVKIPLPDTLARVQSALQSVGMSGMADDLQTRINRAAEQATPVARDIFLRAIRTMSVSDAQGILNGPNDAATQYLRRTTGADIGNQMRPHIDRALQSVGAIQSYERMMGAYRNIPGVPDARGNLSDWTRDKGLDGIFHYVAREETDIRANPGARTTELLRKVFG